MTPRILIVEDNSCYAELLAYLLRLHSYEVEIAETGKHALQLLGEKHFDAALVDHWMPETDGIEMVSEMRSRGHRQGVVVLTALVPSEVEKRTEGLEIWSVVEKNRVSEARLLEVVEEAVEFTKMAEEAPERERSEA